MASFTERAHLRDNNWEWVKECHSQRKVSFGFCFSWELSEESILKQNSNTQDLKKKYNRRVKTSFLGEVLNRSNWKMWSFEWDVLRVLGIWIHGASVYREFRNVTWQEVYHWRWASWLQTLMTLIILWSMLAAWLSICKLWVCC